MIEIRRARTSDAERVSIDRVAALAQILLFWQVCAHARLCAWEDERARTAAARAAIHARANHSSP